MRGLAAGLLAIAVLGGCGSAGGGDKAAYVRAGDGICRDYSAAIAKLGQPTTLKQIGPYITGALPVLTKTVAALVKLDPPGELADEYAKFRDAATATVGRATALRDAAAKADSAEVERLLAEASAAGKTRSGLAAAAGLQACAQL